VIVLGVDPGGSDTGLVIRQHDRLIWHTTVSGGWEPVLEALHRLPVDNVFFDAVAVEEVVAPGGFRNGRRDPINVKGLIGTAEVAGAVAAWTWTEPTIRLLWIPPAHNGQGALDAYPDDLRPSRGQGKGHDALRHARSAWDVAGTAALELRGAPVP
jgi:hypothetical protein